MEVSFYLDIGSLVLGIVVGAILTLGILFAVAASKAKKLKARIPNN